MFLRGHCQQAAGRGGGGAGRSLVVVHWGLQVNVDARTVDGHAEGDAPEILAAGRDLLDGHAGPLGRLTFSEDWSSCESDRVRKRARSNGLRSKQPWGFKQCDTV